MKEYMAAAANFVATGVGGELKPLIEVIVIVSEPQYVVDATGTLVRSRTVDQMRFGTSPAGLRVIAETFTKWADEAERELANSLELEPGEGPPAGKDRPS